MCWGREIEEPRNENYSTCQSVPASLLERITTMAPMLSSFGSGFSRAAHLPEALPVGRVLAGQPLRFHGRLGCSPDLRISAVRGSETILVMKKKGFEENLHIRQGGVRHSQNGAREPDLDAFSALVLASAFSFTSRVLRSSAASSCLRTSRSAELRAPQRKAAPSRRHRRKSKRPGVRFSFSKVH